LKSNFFNEPRYEVQKFSKAAKLIENARRDYAIILEDEFETEKLIENARRDYAIILEDEFETETINKHIVPILSEYLEKGESKYLSDEYLEKGESKYLSDLEKKAYERVVDRYF